MKQFIFIISIAFASSQSSLITKKYKDEIKQLISLLSNIDNSKSFALGIIVGRIYNAFYYQSKRILNREPTKSEFEEFLEFIQNKKSD